MPHPFEKGHFTTYRGFCPDIFLPECKVEKDSRTNIKGITVLQIQKNKNEALVNIAQAINDPDQVREIVDQLNEKKKPTDLRKGGIILIFIGFGLAGFGVLSIPILKSVGFLVSSLGIGLLVAGYIYPNESEEITKAVESFEK